MVERLEERSEQSVPRTFELATAHALPVCFGVQNGSMPHGRMFASLVTFVALEIALIGQIHNVWMRMQ